MSSMVDIKNISKQFGETIALDNVNLTIEEGQFFALVGPSGSGKTTLLQILGGFIEPSQGQVRIGGSDITHLPPARRPTTSMFQDYALFPHMSVGSNVGFGLLMQKVARRERRKRVRAALEMVGLTEMEKRRTDQISGGQKQRVALARALVVQPKVLLLDEPLGALDLNLRRQMQYELLHIQKKVGTTFVHVTHDQEEAMSIADVIAVMNLGRIEDVGSPDRVYLRPKTLFTATFMGESNMFAGTVIGQSNGLVAVRTPIGCFEVEGQIEVGTPVQLLIRPEQVAVDQKSDGSLTPLGRIKVQHVSFFGTHHRCHGKIFDSDLTMTVRIPQNYRVQIGEILPIYISRNDIVIIR